MWLAFYEEVYNEGKEFRVNPWAGRPLIACESSTRQLGVRS
mgnify:CR=1 FL=1